MLRITGAALTLVTYGSVCSVADTQQVWIVGPPGPGVFSPTLQPAIDAATSGDVVLVKPGAVNSPWAISGGKSLSIIGESGGAVFVGPGSVSQVPTSGRVMLRGLGLVAQASFSMLSLADSSGPIWLEDCFVSTNTFGAPGSQPVMRVSECASVTLQNCTVVGTPGNFPPTEAFASNGSNLSLFDCTIRGAQGPDFSSDGPLFHGATAAVIKGGLFFASGCLFLGGQGGNYVCCGPPTTMGEPGGNGLELHGPAYLLDCTMEGGAGSSGPAGFGPAGTPLTGTSPSLLPGPARHYSVTSPVREQQLMSFTLRGVPGENGAIFYSADPMIGLLSPGFGGVFVASLSGAETLLLGRVPASGLVSVSFT